MSDGNLLATFAGASFGIFFLYAFYRAVEAKWPESYFPHDSAIEYRISSSPFRYAGFRFGPVYVTCLFVAVGVDRAHGRPLLAVVGIILGHTGATTISASLRDFRATRRRPALLFLRTVVTVGILVTGILSVATRDLLQDLVPSLRDVAVALWTALFAAIIGLYVVRVSESRRTSSSDLIRRARAAIDPDLWEAASEEAGKADTDPTLVRAIMIVENLQRPRWFRSLERVKGKVIPSGSYGIMQVDAPAPISDLDSVRRAVNERLRGIQVPRILSGYEEEGEQGSPDMDEVRQIALRYNPDAAFADLVVSTYSDLHYSAL